MRQAKKAGPRGAGTGSNRGTYNSISSGDPLQVLLSRLTGVKKCGKGWQAHCPAHDDKNPSLSIAQGDDGRALLHCHAGCVPEVIVAAIGLTMGDLSAPREASVGAGPSCTRQTQREYTSPDDAVASLLKMSELRGGEVTLHQYTEGFIVVRFDFHDGRKSFRPIHYALNEWAIGVPPGKLPLYRLHDLLDADTVYVCEGENAVNAAQSIGLAATTSSQGSASPHKTNWKPLAGKNVVILPDNDDPGRKYAEAVARIVIALGCRAKIILLPGLPEGGDIVDLVAGCSENQTPTDIARDIEDLAAQTPLWQPAKVNDNLMSLQWRPFPVDVLPEPLRSFVIVGAKAIGCDPVMIAFPALVAVASCIGTARCVRLKRSWLEPCVLWCAVVADSGTLKSPSLDYAVQAIRELQTERFQDYDRALTRYERDKLTYEANLATWKRKKNDRSDPPEKPEPPVCQRYIVSDTTIEALAPILVNNPRGLFLARDELSGWLGGFNQYKSGRGSDVANWLEMHRAGAVTVDRKTGVRLIYVPRAAVSVTGTIQPGTLRRALTVEFFENGLAARLLLAMPPKRRKKWTDADVSPRTIECFAEVLNQLLKLQHNKNERDQVVPVEVPLSPDGKRKWVSWYAEHAKRQDEAHGDLAAALSKIEGCAARFALVFHYIQWAASPDFPVDAIGTESIEAGIELARWLAHEAGRVYGILSETDEDRARRELVEYIRLRGGSVTVRDLMRSGPCFKTADDARAALDDLASGRLGGWASPAPTSRGGHPTKRFRLTDTTDTDTTRAGIPGNGSSVSVSGSVPDESDVRTESPDGWSAEAWGMACEAEVVGEPVSIQTESGRKTA